MYRKETSSGTNCGELVLRGIAFNSIRLTGTWMVPSVTSSGPDISGRHLANANRCDSHQLNRAYIFDLTSQSKTRKSSIAFSVLLCSRGNNCPKEAYQSSRHTFICFAPPISVHLVLLLLSDRGALIKSSKKSFSNLVNTIKLVLPSLP